MRLSRAFIVTAALVLGTAPSVVSLQVAGAQAPSTSIILPSNGATVSGTSQVLDARASSAVSQTQVQFEITGGVLTDSVIATAIPSYFGWIALWNTTTVANGTYALRSVASASGVSGTSTAISVTVDNVPLATEMLVPPAGGTVLGIYSPTAILDASAQGTDITGVQFVVNAPRTPVVNVVVATATLTFYGWIGEWNLSNGPSVPPTDPMTVQSVVTQAGGATAISAPVSIQVITTF